MRIARRTSLPVLIGTYVLLLSNPTLSESSLPATSTPVQGEVLMLTSELVVVALADGTRRLFHVDKDTTVDSSLRVADRVEVRVTSDDHVISIKKQTADAEPLQ